MSLAGFGAALLAVSSQLGCCDPNALPAPKAQNVILMVVDTLRADHLGTYGYSRRTSPFLDRFAEKSIVLENVVAASSWTLPSVASVMTGTYPALHGLRAESGGEDFVVMRAGLETLPEVLRDAGYHNVLASTNPWLASGKQGLQRGYETIRVFESPSADQVHAFAREQLEASRQRADGQPLFAYLHYMDVHAPYDQPGGIADLGATPTRYQRELGRLEQTRVPLYMKIAGAERLEHYVDAYDQGIRSWDTSFGEFLTWLETNEWLDDTIIVMISDHGEEFLEHEGWSHGATLYQEQLWVPWIMHIPRATPRRIDNTSTSLIDVAPTILHQLGIPIPDTMQGRNALAPSASRPRRLFSETEVELGGIREAGLLQRAMLVGRVKAIASQNERRCFDLAEDPREQEPIPVGARCEAQLFEQLEAWSEEMHKRGEILGQLRRVEMSPTERQRLEALGYAE